MAEKISNYPAYSSPLNSGALFDVSDYDGVNYTSSKISASELKSEISQSLSDVIDAGNAMDAEQKIVFNSSGTNRVFAEDSNSNAKIFMNADSLDDVTIATGAAYGMVPFIQVSGQDASYGLGDSDGDINFYMDGVGAQKRAYIYARNGSNDSTYFEIMDNRAMQKTSNNSSDSLAIVVGGRGAIFPSGRVNAPVLGGNGVEATLDGAAHCETIVLQNPTVPSNASDTGVPGQLAWDGSFFYICTAANTWVRTAISTW